MDFDLLNFSGIARQVGIKPQYCWQILRGIRTPEKRIEQIAGVLKMDVSDLKAQIHKNKMRRGGIQTR